MKQESVSAMRLAGKNVNSNVVTPRQGLYPGRGMPRSIIVTRHVCSRDDWKGSARQRMVYGLIRSRCPAHTGLHRRRSIERYGWEMVRML